MWAAHDNGANLSMFDAKTHCEHYTGGGYDDWRMLPQDEFATLFDLTDYKSNGYSIAGNIKLTGCCGWPSGRKDARVLPVRNT